MNILVDYSVELDVKNYISKIYHGPQYSHGRNPSDLKRRLLSRSSQEIKTLFSTNLAEKEVADQLRLILSHDYEARQQFFDDKMNNLTNMWKETGSQIEYRLSTLFDQPFPFASETLTINFTTISICPYNYSERMIYCAINHGTREQLSIILHELNHFMFYYYFSDLKATLGEEKYELLKESLTLFSNPEQSGKPAERALRDLFLSQSWTSLDKAIEAGVGLLSL